MEEIINVVAVTTGGSLDKCVSSGSFIKQWEGLLKESIHHTYFQTPHWVLNYLKVYRSKFDPFLIVVYIDYEMVGLAPFVKNKLTGEVSHIFADYCDILAVTGFESIVVRKVLKRICAEPGVRKFCINQIAKDSPTARVIDEVTKELGLKCVKDIGLPQSVNIIDSDWLKGFMRKESIKRRFNHYRRQGTLELRRIDTREMYDKYFHIFKKQLTVRQLVTGRKVAFDDPLKEDLHDALFNGPGGNEVINFSVLLSNNDPIAFHYGYRYKDVLYWGAQSIDMEEERHSPGIVLFLMHISKGLESGLKAIDLTIGHQSFKERFSNCRGETYSRIIYFSLYLYMKETLWGMPRRLLRVVFGLLGVRYERREKVKRIFEDVKSLSSARIIRRKISELLGNEDGIRVFEISRNGYGKAVGNLKPITAKEEVIIKEGHMTDLLDLKSLGMKKERYQLMDDAIQNIKGGSKLYVSYKGQSLIGYAWVKEGGETDKLPVHFGKIKLEGNSSVIHGIVLLEKNEIGAKMIISNLTVNLFEHGKKKIFLVLDKGVTINEKDINTMGYRKSGPKNE